MNNRHSTDLLSTALVLYACLAILGGWTLSLLRCLNPMSYGIWFGCLSLAVFILRRRLFPSAHGSQTVFRLKRFRRILPLSWLALTFLILIGGLWYPPREYDYLIYRLPRLIEWPLAGGWHWLPNIDQRANYSGTGIEWIFMPFWLFLRSDRLFFLFNFIFYILLPGQLFVLFRHLGVRRHWAWFWMWVTAGGYGFITQAGGLENDLPGVFFVLASLNFGFRYRASGHLLDWAMALLAAAVLTAIKASNIPLLLPVGFLLLSHCGAWDRRRWLTAIAIGLIALPCSFLPQAVLNARQTGSWTGDPDNRDELEAGSPHAGLLGNGIQLVVGLVHPPVLPVPNRANPWVRQRLPRGAAALLERDFPRFRPGFAELPDGDRGSLGLGILLTILGALALSVTRPGRGCHHPMAHRSTGGRPDSANAPNGMWRSIHRLGHPSTILWAGWIAAFAYSVKLGSEATARLMLPYYPLLLATILRWLRPLSRRQRRLMTAIGCCSLLSGMPILILNPARPLWPWHSTLTCLEKRLPDGSTLAGRLRNVYEVYAQRGDELTPLLECIPADSDRIAAGNLQSRSESSLWRPYGQRIVLRVADEDLPALDIPVSADVEWLVLRLPGLPTSMQDIDAWAQAHGHRIVCRKPIEYFASVGPEDWAVIQLFSNTHGN